MVKKSSPVKDPPIDVFESVKRGFIHKGIIPRRYRRNARASNIVSNGEGRPGKKPKQTNAKNYLKTTPPQEENGDDNQVPQESEPGEVHEKLIDITEKAQDILFKADTVFPLTLFPDTITLDREKLTLANRWFFRTANIITVPINSMVSAEASVGPFFGSVTMTSKYFVQNTHSVHFLWRRDAIEVQRLLQGYILAQERNIDVSDIDKEDLITLLHDLGQGVSD